jgi:hypothetical protein
MKGIVGVVAQEIARFTEFWGDLQTLEAPDGVEVHIKYSGTLGQTRQAMVEYFLSTDAEWLMMIDDDHAVSPEYLRRWLYRHEPALNAKIRHPIVASLYLQRTAPFPPALYGPPEGDGDVVDLPLLSLNTLPTSGIVPVYAAGASGMFVRRDVYERLPPPWYRLGQSDAIGEDFAFCVYAQRAGIPVMVDLDSHLGHLTTWAVWPAVVEGEWATVVKRGRVSLVIDAAETETLTAKVPAAVLA